MKMLSDISKLRLEMKIFQAKVKGLYRKGLSSDEIAEKLNVTEKSIRVIIKWMDRKVKKNEYHKNKKVDKEKAYQRYKAKQF